MSYKKKPSTSGVPVYVYMVKLISQVGVYASMTQDMLKYHLAGVTGIYSMHLCSKGTECATSNAQSWPKIGRL